jgi:hypothetical protein
MRAVDQFATVLWRCAHRLRSADPRRRWAARWTAITSSNGSLLNQLVRRELALSREFPAQQGRV